MLRGFLSRLGWVGLPVLFLGTSPLHAEPDRALRQGQFNVLTYNVAGLPEGLSNVRPTQTLPLVGALLNKFDLVLVQEDFAYPELLRKQLRLPYRTAPFVRGQALHFGDGLSLFSKLPLADVKRTAWAICHGVYDSYSDCLTPKGFAFTRVELTPGTTVDVYDAHLDAGAGNGDKAARAAQLDQLTKALREQSADRALVLGGDFNLTAAELPDFRRRMAELGIADTCDALACGQERRLDRVLLRSGGAVTLKPKAWRVVPGFRDPQGRALSDHEPVLATVGWSVK
jgi:endonuclease/exonuclease/phosphatase family metal-dependent hydrolase